MKRATTANNMFALWPGDKLNFSIFIKPTFGFADSPQLRQPATSQTQTLVAIGPGQICVSKNNGRQFSNKNFPRGQVNGFADNLDFEKLDVDRLKNNTADPSHF